VLFPTNRLATTEKKTKNGIVHGSQSASTDPEVKGQRSRLRGY